MRARLSLFIGAGLFALVGAIVVAIVVTTRHGDQPRPRELPIGEGAISIQVVNPIGAPITIDGKRVGKAPLILHMPRSAKLLLVESPGRPAKQVVADHDQIVDLMKAE